VIAAIVLHAGGVQRPNLDVGVVAARVSLVISPKLCLAGIPLGERAAV